MGAHSRDQAMELVRCQILADEEASIQKLQQKLERREEKLPNYQSWVTTILERLQEWKPKAYIMVFEPSVRGGWRLVVGEETAYGAEDNGTVAFARQIRTELGASEIEITGPIDKP